MEILRDLITGKPVSEYEDEPIRQDTEARLLELGYAREQIQVDPTRQVELEGKPQTIRADLLVSRQGRPALVLRCARGSMVTRHNEVLATARALCDPWVPLAVVTNRYDAHLLDTKSGRLLAQGLEAIPGPAELDRLLADIPPHHPTSRELERAVRVYLALEALQGECGHRCRIQAELQALEEAEKQGD